LTRVLVTMILVTRVLVRSQDMHPYLLETFANDRTAAITRSAGARRSRRPRQRIGWMLVAVGLRLIGDGTTRRHPAPVGG
jgi:hypothetical protein